MTPRQIRESVQTPEAFKLSDDTRRELGDLLIKTRMIEGGISLREIAEIFRGTLNRTDLKVLREQL